MPVQIYQLTQKRKSLRPQLRNWYENLDKSSSKISSSNIRKRSTIGRNELSDARYVTILKKWKSTASPTLFTKSTRVNSCISWIVSTVKRAEFLPSGIISMISKTFLNSTINRSIILPKGTFLNCSLYQQFSFSGKAPSSNQKNLMLGIAEWNCFRCLTWESEISFTKLKKGLMLKF